MSIIPNYVPGGFKIINVMLSVPDAHRALEWYNRALGAEEVMRLTDSQGKIAHAEMKIADQIFMLTEGPAIGENNSVVIQLYTPDVDSLMEDAEVAGAEILKRAKLEFYGDKCGRIKDPFGHQWILATHVETIPAKEMQRRFQELS